MTTNITEGELRQFVERIEHLNAEISDMTECRRDVYTELKGRGYDAGVVRKLIAIRKRRADDLAEEDAILAMYKSAMGME